MAPIGIHLRDLNGSLVEAWRREFAGVPSIEISHGDIFSTKQGAVSGGELPVGQALIVPTGRSEIPWCISAPTMRIPGSPIR